MPRTLLPALLLSVTLLASCSTVKSKADWEPGTDFTVYTSYAWLPQTPTGDASEFLIDRIQSSVDAELAAKGLKLAAEGEATLMVTQRVSVTEKLQANDPYYSYAPYETYEEGTLVIDFVDSKTRKLVWRGTGETRIADVSDPNERAARVAKVVKAVLDRYPPQ